MTARIRSLTFDCAAPAEEGAIVGLDNGTLLLFLKVPEGKTAKNRIHFDLQPDLPRLREVERLSGLGASVLHHIDQPGDVFTVMLDPEGNEFCVEPSLDERAEESG